MHIDEEGRSVEWDGLPRSLMINIEQDFDILTAHPFEMLNMVIAEQIESTRGFRPHDEIFSRVKKSIEIKTNNPFDDYDPAGIINRGTYGEVYGARRRSDDQVFAIKRISKISDEDFELVI